MLSLDKNILCNHLFAGHIIQAAASKAMVATTHAKRVAHFAIAKPH